MYNVNDFIVYKKDVCKIENIKNINGKDYYIIVPIDDNSLKITIPTDNEINIRKPITQEEANDLIDKIPNIKELEDLDEKFIENTYKELIRKGNHEDLIKIIKTTYLRNKERLDNRKKISEKDNNYFNLAEKYLYNELSISLNLSFEETKQYIIDKVSNLLVQ